MMLGSHFKVVAEGGKAAPYASRQYSLLLRPLSTNDIVFSPQSAGTYPIVEGRRSLSDAGTMGSVEGGMQTCIDVAP